MTSHGGDDDGDRSPPAMASSVVYDDLVEVREHARMLQSVLQGSSTGMTREAGEQLKGMMAKLSSAISALGTTGGAAGVAPSSSGAGKRLGGRTKRSGAAASARPHRRSSSTKRLAAMEDKEAEQTADCSTAPSATWSRATSSSSLGLSEEGQLLPPPPSPPLEPEVQPQPTEPLAQSAAAEDMAELKQSAMEAVDDDLDTRSSGRMRTGPMTAAVISSQQRHNRNEEMEAAISASQGAMRSLPRKLESLLSGTKYGLRAEERNKILILQGELQGIIDNYLIEPSEVESPTSTANSWMLDLRDLSYDIDDFIYELAHICGGGARISVVVRKPPRIKLSRFPEKLKRRQWITEEISGFRIRVKEAIEWHKEYQLGNCKWRPSSSSSSLGGRRPLQSPCSEAGIRLVGLDSSINMLCGWLADDGRQPEHRVASIVGSGGVGKTTLAKEMYRKLGGQFECLAFVRTSRKPDTKVLLASILSQVQRRQLPDDPDVQELVFKINKHLKDKMYLIVIDDMWELSTWDIVNRALPKGNCCSRILTTTEVNVIAQKCCADNSKYMSTKKEDNSMYIPSKAEDNAIHTPLKKEDNYRYIIKMRPLCEDESRELFLSTAFGQQAECLPQRFKEVSNEIIKRSGGLPLAVKILASLVAHRPDSSLEQWNYIKDSLGSGLTTNNCLEVINQVLKLGYDNLPHGLKACMLYLCMYEEDSVIWKDDLVKQWIIEGFISAVEGEDGEDIAQSYFDELVNRGMIQPVDINFNDEILSCSVHHMVHDFVRYKSIEENFSIAIDHSQTTMKLADKVRRLALHFGNVEDATPPAAACMRLSNVRSLAFSGFLKCMPSIVEFRFLQVLILKLRVNPDSRRGNVTGSDDLSGNITGSDDVSDNLTEHDDLSYNLTEISQLFRLRYFRLEACHLCVELPTQMQRLKDLVAWEIDAEVTSVPSDIVDLPGLWHVSLPSEAYLPTGIGRMTSLRTLGVIDLSKNSIGNVMSLGELTNLQDLRLTCSTLQTDNLEKNLECLGSIIRKLSNLKCVTLVPAVSSHVNTQDDASASRMSISWHGFSTVPLAPALLRRLELSRRCCIFSSLPGWTKELTNLCVLKIAIRKVSSEDVIILKGLPSLTALSLFVWTVPVRRIMFDYEGFWVLKYFKFVCAAPCLQFLDGAMASVRMLKLRFNANRMERYSLVDAGFERLISLNEISTKIGGHVADEYRRYAKSVLTDAISNHPSTPIINVKWVDWNFSGDEGKDIEAQKGLWNQTPERDDVAKEESSDERGIQENSLEGDAKEQADMRTCTPPESTSYMQFTCGASGERKNPYTGTAGDELASDRTNTLQVADATLQKAAAEARESRSRELHNADIPGVIFTPQRGVFEKKIQVYQGITVAHSAQDTEIEEVLDANEEAEQKKQYLKEQMMYQMKNWDEASMHFSQEQYAIRKLKMAAHGEQEVRRCDGLEREEHDDRTGLDIQRVSMKNGISTEDLKLPLIEKHTTGISMKQEEANSGYGDVYKGQPRIPKFGDWENSEDMDIDIPYAQKLEGAWKNEKTGVYSNPNEPGRLPEPSPMSPLNPSAYTPDPRERGSRTPLLGRKPANDPHHREAAPQRHTDAAGSALQIQSSSPSKPRHRAAGMQSAERRASSNAHGQHTSTSRMRQSNQGYNPEEEVDVLPFGEWDEANVASEEGYTHIFQRVRDDKSSAGQHSSGNRTEGSKVEQTCSCRIL